MKKTLIFMVTLAMALMFGVSTASAWFVSIEPVASVDVTGIDTFYADLFFNPDPGGNTVHGYQLSIDYDETELTWISATAGAQHTPISPLIALFGNPYERDGEIINWSASHFTLAAEVAVKTPIAHIAFETHADNFFDGELDVWLGSGPGGDSIKVDDVNYNFGHFTVVQGPDVAAVPIPGAVFLLGSGLLGLIGVRKRKVMG